MSEKRVFRQFMFDQVSELPPAFYGANEDVKFSDGPPPEHAQLWMDAHKDKKAEKKTK